MVAAFDGGPITSDAGALLLRQVDQRLSLIDQVADCFTDHRNPSRIQHSLRTLIAQRIVAIALGYEDVNDHDQLRHDPLMALFSEKSWGDSAPLAGKSTLNRFELAPSDGPDRYHKIDHDHEALQALLVELFSQAHSQPPDSITLDLDATDDPLHGEQQLDLFADRTSTHTFRANQLRLSLTACAYVLMEGLRRDGLKHTYLARATVGSLRLKLLKIGTQITTSVRRIKVAMASGCPYQREFHLAWAQLRP